MFSYRRITCQLLNRKIYCENTDVFDIEIKGFSHMARVRSPNYPSMSLPSAIEKVGVIHKAEGKNNISREGIAKLLGFNGLHGASSTALSALSKYGLLDNAKDGEARVSDLAIRILYADNDSEKRAALEDAASRPTLFKEIKEKWPDRPPTAENLKSFLARNGFAPASLDAVIQIYRDTIDSIGGAGGDYDWATQKGEAAAMNQNATVKNDQSRPAPPPPAASPIMALGDRPFSVSFDGSILTGVISIKKAKDIDRLMKVLQAQKAAFEAMQDDAEDVVEENPEDGA
jgi:hypothetical protein